MGTRASEPDSRLWTPRYGRGDAALKDARSRVNVCEWVPGCVCDRAYKQARYSTARDCWLSCTNDVDGGCLAMETRVETGAT